MDRPLLVDADVLIDYLRGLPVAAALLRADAQRIALSSIVVAELYAGVKGDTERETLDELVSCLRVVPVTAEIARTAGLLKRDYGTSHGVGLADAILAATAQAENADLCTLNVKHYPMLKGLRPAYVKP